MSDSVYLVDAKRTPIGSFLGSLSTVTSPVLGATAIKAVLNSANVSPDNIDECIMGNVLTAGVGQAPARQAALYAGLPNKVPCLTINKVCGSGLKSIMLAADSIRLGHSDLVIAGGQENMSLSPHLLENSRSGYRMGHQNLSDSMIKDGLWDPYNNWHMGNAAELCVKEHTFSREEQDQFAIESYKRAQSSIVNGSFNQEICSVEISSRKGTITVNQDEEPGKAQFDKMPQLKGAFEKEGTITAANASKINDGGAAVLLASESAVKKFGLKPMAKIVNYTTFAQDPKWFTTAPVGAMKKSLELAKLNVKDIDQWEINEAFSVVTMVAARELKISSNVVNPFGGAVALGHPIGASGTRIFTTLLHGLRNNNKKYGMAGICIGGGEAVSILVENL